MKAAGAHWSFGEAVPEGPAAAPAPAKPPGDYAAGDRFGAAYEIHERLGQGGMGVVYRAREVHSGRDVALKLLTQAVDPKARERFRREGELTASLQHPGIVKVHAGGELNGTPFLAYELISGRRTLGELLEERDRDGLVRLLCEVAEAVGHAHERGVVHRDLKPENILIDPAGAPRVADFGLAKLGRLGGLTATGVMVGTPAYMPPEQICGEGGMLGPPSDVWALGVLLYRCLTGERPFDGETIYELSGAVVNAAPVPPRTHDPSISKGVQAVCLMALEKDPAARYPNATAFAADLRNALELRPVSAAAPARRLLSWGRGHGRRALFVMLVLAPLALALWAVLADDSIVPPLQPPGRSAHRSEDLLEQARAHLDAGDVEAADRAVRRYLAERRDRPGLILLARIQIAAGLVGDAARTSAEVTASHPGWAAELLRAEVAEARGEDPRPLLRGAIERWPTRSEPKLALARSVLERTGDVFAAREVLAGESGRTAEVLRELTELPPVVERAKAVPVWLKAAGARWLLEEGLRDAEFLSNPPRTQAPEDVLDSAVRQRRARALLEGALALSDDPELVRRANAGLAGESAKPPLEPAAGPEERRRAMAIYDHARATANPISIESCQQVLALDPDHVLARYILGRERFVRRENRAGLRDCLRAIQRDPRLVNDLCAQLMVVCITSGGLLHARTLGSVLEELGDVREDFLDHAIHAFLLCMIAEFEGRPDRIDEALDALQELLEADPLMLWPRVLSSFLHLRQGRYAQAQRDLRIVNEVVPDIGVVHFLSALLALRRGERSAVVQAHLARGQRFAFRLEGYREQVLEIYPALAPHLKGN